MDDRTERVRNTFYKPGYSGIAAALDWPPASAGAGEATHRQRILRTRRNTSKAAAKYHVGQARPGRRQSFP
jgi:hypothetical protein